jgi:hypothetical protein
MRLENLYLLAYKEKFSKLIPTEDYADSSLKRLIWVPETVDKVVVLTSAGMKSTWEPGEPLITPSTVFIADREFIDYHRGGWYRPRLKEFRRPPKRAGDRRHPHSSEMYKWLWQYENRRREVIDLSPRDTERLVEAILNPPEPNQKLIEAIKQSRRLNRG